MTRVLSQRARYVHCGYSSSTGMVQNSHSEASSPRTHRTAWIPMIRNPQTSRNAATGASVQIETPFKMIRQPHSITTHFLQHTSQTNNGTRT